MSWIDKLANDLIITTGDGRSYYPLWKKPSKSIAFNYSEFTFPNLSGSLVDRGTPMGRRFPLEIYFVGENNIEDSSEFESSANDKRPWKIEHPYYGLIFVQPTEINFDNTSDNLTKINVGLIETITDTNPKTRINPLETIKLKKLKFDSELEQNITSTITPIDTNVMIDVNKKNYNLSVPIIKIPKEAESFYNAFNQASSFINSATATPILIARSVISVMSYPANFTASTQTRINTLVNVFNELEKNISNITTVAGKQIYQIQAGAILSAMCIAASTPLAKDFTNSKSVLNIIDTISTNGKKFFDNLDLLQTLNGGSLASYIPTADSIITLSGLISYTLSNLYIIALNSETEKSIIVEKDTNALLLTHRFYGLSNDENLNKLFSNNNWGLNHILQIKKGTKVIYYT